MCEYVFVCVCERARARACMCMRVCVCVCVRGSVPAYLRACVSMCVNDFPLVSLGSTNLRWLFTIVHIAILFTFYTMLRHVISELNDISSSDVINI